MADNGQLTRKDAAKIEKERDLTFSEYLQVYMNVPLGQGKKITRRALTEAYKEYNKYRAARTEKFLNAAMSGVYDQIKEQSKRLEQLKTPQGQLQGLNEFAKTIDAAIKAERGAWRDWYLANYDNLTEEERTRLLPAGMRDPANDKRLGKYRGKLETALTPLRLKIFSNLADVIPEAGGPLLSQVGGQRGARGKSGAGAPPRRTMPAAGAPPRRTMPAPQPRQPNRRMQPVTAVNPQTGERLIQDPQTGQWVPLPGTSRPNALPAPQ